MLTYAWVKVTSHAVVSSVALGHWSLFLALVINNAVIHVIMIWLQLSYGGQ